MARPRVTNDGESLSFVADVEEVEVLDLIGRASTIGTPSRSAMLRLALHEFIESRMADASIRQFVESHLSTGKQALHIVHGRPSNIP